MSIPYIGKYVDSSIVLYTKLAELPKIDFTASPYYHRHNDCDWDYEKWTIKNGMIVFSKTGIKDPLTDDLEYLDFVRLS